MSPEIYSGMLKAAYGAIKSAQPDAAVIGVSGGPTGTNRPPEGAVGIMDFVRDHSPSEEYTDAHERYRGFVLFHRTQAASALAAERNDAEGAIDAIREGLHKMRAFFVDLLGFPE